MAFNCSPVLVQSKDRVRTFSALRPTSAGAASARAVKLKLAADANATPLMRNKLRRETSIRAGPATQFFSRGLAPISQEEIKGIGVANAEKSSNELPIAQLRLRTGSAI